MRSRNYGTDVLAAGPRPQRRAVPEVPAAAGEVVEHAETGFTGAVVGVEHGAVRLEDRHGRERLFPLATAAFAVDGEPVTLVRPTVAAAGPPARTASGSVAVRLERAPVARGSRIWVEGRHDAELVEKVWGDDLRVEGVVVEMLDGIDDLVTAVAAFAPTPQRRLGVLVDHLVPGSKESRIVAGICSPHVRVVGHPYVDVWQAVKPARLGLDAWPVVPPGRPWKGSVAAALGAPDVPTAWRRVLAAVSSYADLEPELSGPVESLIDFVTEAPGA